MTSPSGDQFSNVFTLFFTVLGCAVGTGNLWRFPRIVAQEAGPEGGGAFLLQWILFLCIWSIPLIIGEYAVGKNTRVGIAQSFKSLGGESHIWMGIFMTVVATWIGFYYAVVTGWCWFYLVYVVVNPLPTKPDDAMAVWMWFQSSPWRVIAFLAVVIVAMAICWKGIKILERANAVLVPTLLCLIIGTVIWAFTLPGAGSGLKFMFTPDWRQFLNPTGWINALSQNAWDTSAGYGAVLTYSVYARARDPAVKLGILTPIVNNTISLICGMLIFSISFSLLDQYVSSPDAKLEILKNAGPASTGLTFMWLPLMYSSVGPGRILAIIFFLALSAAALSSLLGLIELPLRPLIDSGLFGSRREPALAIVTFGLLAFGLPSALSLDFLVNQDMVWGLGLILSGLFFSVLIIKYGVNRFRLELINLPPSDDPDASNDWQIGKWWEYVMKFLIPIQVAALLGWWVIYAPLSSGDPQWWNPFKSTSLATVLLQWAATAACCIGINKFIQHRERLVPFMPAFIRPYLEQALFQTQVDTEQPPLDRELGEDDENNDMMTSNDDQIMTQLDQDNEGLLSTSEKDES